MHKKKMNLKDKKQNKNKVRTYNKRDTFFQIKYCEEGIIIMKNRPQRTCMGCNEKKDKKQLIRIVKNKNNEINIDRTGKLEGRGAYICDDIKCLEKLIKSKRLEKVFDTKISDEIYENLRGVIFDK